MTAATFRRAPDVRYRLLDGEAVVVRQRAAEVLGLDPVGSRILDLLDGETTVAELLDRLAAEYDIDRDRIASEVEVFLEELAAAGVVERVERVEPEDPGGRRAGPDGS